MTIYAYTADEREEAEQVEREEKMESWKQGKWAWYCFNKRKIAHWYKESNVGNLHCVIALCGDTAAFFLLEPEETAKTLCKKCLKIKGKKPSNIPAILEPENVLRLIEIGNEMYLLNMKDRWDRQDREEYVKLGAEREKLKNV